MRIHQGQQAPNFCVNDVFNRVIDLQAYKGTKVFLAFFRHAGCPFCNLRVHNLSKISAEAKELGLEMIFFFESKPSVILRSTFHTGVSPIPLISDPDKAWYQAYGVEASVLKSTASHLSTFIPTVIKAKAAGVPVHMPPDKESLATMPAEFLLDQNSIVQRVLYAKSLNDRLDIDEILSFAGKR